MRVVTLLLLETSASSTTYPFVYLQDFFFFLPLASHDIDLSHLFYFRLIFFYLLLPMTSISPTCFTRLLGRYYSFVYLQVIFFYLLFPMTSISPTCFTRLLGRYYSFAYLQVIFLLPFVSHDIYLSHLFLLAY
ncbi:hypothetical protein DFH09DRAFT_98635 [Mycena vulgaris]|nr:hypothetical protein DFH09DRAFT_98635 [Mycena vulgaris]